jgi:hypothetical protein
MAGTNRAPHVSRVLAQLCLRQRHPGGHAPRPWWWSSPGGESRVAPVGVRPPSGGQVDIEALGEEVAASVAGGAEDGGPHHVLQVGMQAISASAAVPPDGTGTCVSRSSRAGACRGCARPRCG